MEVILFQGGIRMTAEETGYQIWIDWERQVVSLENTAGYEMLCFFSREKYQENLRILTESGFRVE